MTAKEFVNKKLGDKNYTHSDYPMSRTEIEGWLNEYHESKVKNFCLFSVSNYPYELESVLAKIEHINSLGESTWYEVVYYDGH